MLLLGIFKANFNNFMKNIIHLVLYHERTTNEVPAPTAALPVSLNKLQFTAYQDT